MAAEPDELLDLFDAALALSGAARAAFVERAVGDRPALRAELESLLAHADVPDDFLERPAAFTPTRPGSPTGAGCQVGPYRLVERLGEGGFGEVWRAEQREPIARTVAVKLIRPGIGSAQARARFAAERQALAWLDHPGIARIHDAGETVAGQPWYAMELVDGPTLREHAGSRRLGLADRLQLVVKVCDALHHAHERGVVHRDLKPTNVLVASGGGVTQPKIIDFGIAKLDDIGDVWRTQDGQVLGTPAYMSPEQARGDVAAIDVRSDVYAVGVLLFELLTGTVPFAPATDSSPNLVELHRRVAEEDAPWPSARIAERAAAAAAGGAVEPPPLLARAVRGELDWIVTKALANAPARRYGSARELAEDLRRFLRDEPVLAGPPSRAYQLRKWLRRHRGVAVAAGLAAILGISGLVGTLWHRQRAERSEQGVQAEAAKLGEVVVFLRELLASADPDRSPGHEVTVREVLEDAERRLGDHVPPEVECALRHTLGTSYRGLGSRLDAERNLRRALLLADRLDAPERGTVRRELGLVFLDAGRTTEARALFDEALELAGDDPLQRVLALDAIGRLFELQAEYGEADGVLRRAIEDADAHDVDPLVQVALRLQRANVLESRGRYAESEALLDVARARADTAGRPGLPLLLQVEAARTRALARRDEAAASALGARCVELATGIYGPEHFEVGHYRCRLGDLLQGEDRLDEAEAEFRAGLAILRAVRPEGSMTEASALADLGWTLSRLGRRDEAESVLRTALTATRSMFGPHHPRVASCLRDLAKALRERGAVAEAEAACREALEIVRARQGTEALGVAVTLHGLALCLMMDARPAEAVDCLEEAVRVAEPVLAAEHGNLIEFRLRLGHALAQAGRFGEAREVLQAVRLVVVRVGGPEDPRIRVCDRALEGVARALGD